VTWCSSRILRGQNLLVTTDDRANGRIFNVGGSGCGNHATMLSEKLDRTFRRESKSSGSEMRALIKRHCSHALASSFTSDALSDGIDRYLMIRERGGGVFATLFAAAERRL